VLEVLQPDKWTNSDKTPEFKFQLLSGTQNF